MAISPTWIEDLDMQVIRLSGISATPSKAEETWYSQRGSTGQDRFDNLKTIIRDFVSVGDECGEESNWLWAVEAAGRYKGSRSN
ncbi:hypothetical protein JMJ77_0013526 [Colletotrichum scovillei]|uniref:Uncharacterized protein n=1 Tax=Colletotrichum scovillei TaxID=1209932 RepID=A0A9P7R8W3_9PEZI|nr:hypothetical protein JMJ77_0013526 [Colletotrichum scovillei]KAG7069830.1 hypothetical protein JMJ76_0003490 [Colletotrichum scovillei]KAG7073741.1 hypothetical protein JMJ78_0014708 [Colletotrichum scovillei]